MQAAIVKARHARSLLEFFVLYSAPRVRYLRELPQALVLLSFEIRDKSAPNRDRRIKSAMVICAQCGTQLQQVGKFRSTCGAQTALYAPGQTYSGPQVSQPQPMSTWRANPHHVAARGFAHTFGVHPGIAILTLAIDSMLFGGEMMTLGGIFPISLAVSVVLGFITYRAQIRWYGDDKESAMIKAVVLALLTAIPTNIPAFLYVPAGIVGLFNRKPKY